ncbi:hypothetical protein E2320_000110 [Naja naja]|nr:hypothetical protein E2320_000110 [Naja naja]
MERCRAPRSPDEDLEGVDEKFFQLIEQLNSQKCVLGSMKRNQEVGTKALGISYGISFFLFLLLLLTCFAGHLAKCFLKGPKILYWIPSILANVCTQPWLRISLGIITILVVLTMSVLNLFFMPETSFFVKLENCTLSSMNTVQEFSRFNSLFSVPYYIYCCVLGFLSCSLFLHMNFELKMTMLILCLVVYNVLFLHTHSWLSDCYVSQLYHNQTALR